jgi:hypothetical protein
MTGDSGLIKVASRNVCGRTEENHESLSQDCGSQVRDSIVGPLEYEAGVTPALPPRQVGALTSQVAEVALRAV